MKLKLLFARFPYGGTTHDDVTDWLVPAVTRIKRHPKIESVHSVRINDTPITMSRNRVLKQAQVEGVDLVCMIDSDMTPDLCLGQPNAKPFLDSSLEFMLEHQGPCVVGAPYCGPPPHENVYIFRWARLQSDHPNVDMRLEQYSREEAAVRTGFEEVAALPTGLILIDMRALKAIRPPWFDYEYSDPPYNTTKCTTEDVFFTRNLSLAGVPQYVNWDAWCGHQKTKCVGKPSVLTVDAIREQFRESIAAGWSSNERLMDIRSDLAGQDAPTHLYASTLAQANASSIPFWPSPLPASTKPAVPVEDHWH